MKNLLLIAIISFFTFNLLLGQTDNKKDKTYKTHQVVSNEVAGNDTISLSQSSKLNQNKVGSKELTMNLKEYNSGEKTIDTINTERINGNLEKSRIKPDKKHTFETKVEYNFQVEIQVDTTQNKSKKIIHLKD